MSETFRLAEPQSALRLTRKPVSEISAVVENGGAALGAGTWERHGRLLYRLDGADRRMAWSAAKIVVTYTGGYDLPGDCPADLAGACRRAVKARFMSRLRDPLLKVRDVPGVIEEEYWVGPASGDPDGLSPDVSGVLTFYALE